MALVDSPRLASPQLARAPQLARLAIGPLYLNDARSVVPCPPSPPPPPPRRLSRISGQAPYTPLVAGTRETAGDGALEMIDLFRPYLPYAYLVAAIDSPSSSFFFPSSLFSTNAPEIFFFLSFVLNSISRRLRSTSSYVSFEWIGRLWYLVNPRIIL